LAFLAGVEFLPSGNSAFPAEADFERLAGLADFFMIMQNNTPPWTTVVHPKELKCVPTDAETPGKTPDKTTSKHE
jgi:hypothetical protein